MDKIDIILEYSNTIYDITNIIVGRHPNNSMILNFSMKIKAAHDADPTLIIEGAGPILFNEQAIILKGIDSIPKIDTDAALASALAKAKKKGKKPSKVEDFIYVIDLVKQDWNAMSKPDREDMYEKIKSLLSIYINYLLIQQD